MKLVLDASAACELVLQRPRAGAFDDALRRADVVLAPDLYVSEVGNALWKYVRNKELDLDSCHGRLESALNLVDQFAPSSALIHEALVTASVTRHPVYDVVYLILARRNGARLLSVDRKLLTLARDNGVLCIGS
jgi:predicted nucleic acid-binding protein